MNDVAVSILADSSIALASQWTTIITNYISNLLTRLLEGRSGDSFNISIVTYATADYRPTPILAKRYFNNPSFVSKELKEEASKLGIGRTGSGGKMGMAALEGYAAVLEMFDLFLSSHRSLKEAAQDKSLADSQTSTPLCHIIHISACPPDDSRHPMWNQTSNLDSISWKTLPDELRKRNINLSMILLKSNKTFTELHSLASPETHQVWFSVSNPAHTLLLSSPASWAPLTTKRANEGNDSDKAADAKRVRVSTPKQAPTASQAVPLPKSAEGGTPSVTTQPGSALPQPAHNEEFNRSQQALAKIREMELYLHQSQAQIELLRQQGRLQDMEDLKRTIQPKVQMLYRLKQFVLAFQMKNIAAASASVDPMKSVVAKPDGTAGPSGQNQPAGPGPGPSNDMSSQPTQAKPNQMVQQLVQTQRQAQQLKAGASSTLDGRPPTNILPHFSPSVAAQMQKLQMKEGIQGQVSMSSAPIQQHQPHQQLNSMNQSMQHAGSLPQNQQPGFNGNQTWAGTLSWLSPQSMNPMEAQVRMTSKTNIRPELLPSTFEVELLRDQSVPLPALKEWMAHHKPVICHMKPVARSVDPHENELRFKSLSSLLSEKNVYAVGKWAPPGNVVKPMLLLFPMGGDGGQMVAAVFSESGVPELPRANPQATLMMRPSPAASQLGGNANQAQMLMMLQNMNPEARMQFMARIRQQQQIQQAQAQQAAAGANGGNGNPANPNPLVNLSGGGWPGGLPGGGMGQAMQNVQAGMPGGMNANFAQALAAMQQHQRQNGMPAPPGPPPF